MFRKPLYVPFCGGKNNRVLQTFPVRNPLTDARILQSTDRIRCEPGILHASNPPPCLNRGVLNQKRPPNRLLVREFYVHNSFHPNTPCATKQMLHAGYHGPIVDFGLPHRNLGVVVGERLFFSPLIHLLYIWYPPPQKPMLLGCLALLVLVVIENETNIFLF